MNSIAALPSAPVPRREPANVELTRELLAYLSSGDVRPGQRLPGERALSEAMGVGRAALREAIKSLILLGVLEQRQGDGTYLASEPSSLLPKVVEWGLWLGKNQLSDLIEARQVLEVDMARMAAAKATVDDLRNLETCIEEMRSAGNNFDRYIDADIQFHLSLAAAAHNDVLAGVLRNIRSLVQAWTERVIRAAQETQTSLAMHEPVLAAVEARDVDAAGRTMQALMDRASHRLGEALGEAPSS